MVTHAGALRGCPPHMGVAAYFSVPDASGRQASENSRVGGMSPLNQSKHQCVGRTHEAADEARAFRRAKLSVHGTA